jgi:hypothetical protein
MNAQPYYFVCTRRLKPHKLRDLTKKLDEFTYVKQIGKFNQINLNDPRHDYSPEIEYKADTLYVLLSARRAVLFQKKRQPFTLKDLRLRKIIFNLYPGYRLPLFKKEPHFETQ